MSLEENKNQSVTDFPGKEADNEEENLSFFDKIKKSFPSVKRKASDGSNSASSEDDTRRDSLQSNLSLPAGLDLSRRRPSSSSTFGEKKTISEEQVSYIVWLNSILGAETFQR